MTNRTDIVEIEEVPEVNPWDAPAEKQAIPKGSQGAGPSDAAPVKEAVLEPEEVKDNPTSGEEPPVNKKVVFQFRYKRYHWVSSILDPAKDQSGQPQHYVVKARNWRTEIDRADPFGEELYQSLIHSPAYGVTYWILTEKEKTSSIVSRSETLKKLMSMHVQQLSNMLDPDEKKSVGLPVNCVDKMQLIMAIIDTKELTEIKEL
jgi:hypothetical protein